VSVSDPWEDEGFGGENDWAAESVEKDVEKDVEEDELLEDEELEDELDQADLAELDDDGK
jgi:hypothetical protein